MTRVAVGLVAAGPLDRSPLRGHGDHDNAEREHREPHEFKYQRVHGNVPLQIR
jgi:hypothetical protein